MHVAYWCRDEYERGFMHMNIITSDTRTTSVSLLHYTLTYISGRLYSTAEPLYRVYKTVATGNRKDINGGR